MIRGGTVRVKQPDGEWKVYEPGDVMYSTALMAAQEYWNGKEWVAKDAQRP